MKKEPDCGDLLKIFSDYDHQYLLVGVGLAVNVADLQPLPQMTTNNLITVFQRWKAGNKDVTWGKIAKICEDYKEKLGKVQSDLRKYLSSEEAHDKYLEKPDSQ